MLDIHKIRQDFPILSREVDGKPLVYLDNAATSQKPRCVIETITDGYTRINANVHRGVHRLSQEATDGHEHARRRVQQFLHAAHDREIIRSEPHSCTMAMKSSFRRWNTTPTSSPGNYYKVPVK